MQVTMREAEAQLSRLGELAWDGEEVVIAKAGKPYLRLTPYHDEPRERPLGLWKGKVRISPDFDDDADIIDSFYDSKIFPIECSLPKRRRRVYLSQRAVRRQEPVPIH